MRSNSLEEAPHEVVVRSGLVAVSDADRDEQWVSWVRAAELLGRHVSTVQLYVAQGRLRTRVRQGARPSVYLPSVHGLAAELRAERRARAARAGARAARRAAKRADVSAAATYCPDLDSTIPGTSSLVLIHPCGSPVSPASQRTERRAHTLDLSPGGGPTLDRTEISPGAEEE